MTSAMTWSISSSLSSCPFGTFKSFLVLIMKKIAILTEQEMILTIVLIYQIQIKKILMEMGLVTPVTPILMGTVSAT